MFLKALQIGGCILLSLFGGRDETCRRQRRGSETTQAPHPRPQPRPPETTPVPPPQSPHSCRDGLTLRVRKNVNSLTSQERRRLDTALRATIRSREYQKIGNFHGAPRTLCRWLPDQICCPHGDIGFLPWHRLLMVHMEDELGEALPYWDWTEYRRVPSLWRNIQGPIQQPPGGRRLLGGCSRNTFTSRNSRYRIRPARLKNQVRHALRAETFEAFSDRLSQPHNALHNDMGCDMLFNDISAYDPLFYLHHTYVDYVFAFWQELQLLRGHTTHNNNVPRRRRGLTRPLAPFTNRRVNKKPVTLRNNRGIDTFEYKTNYCYQYQDLKFNGLTPQEFHRRRSSTCPLQVCFILFDRLAPLFCPIFISCFEC